MENVSVSRRNPNYKKGNKENSQPAFGCKSFIKRDKTSAPPFQLKSNQKEDPLSKNGPLKAKSTQADTRPLSKEALNKVKTVLRSGAGASVTDVKQRQTHSQAFLTRQAAKHQKIVEESTKPPPPVPVAKFAPGMYKGKIIQSKIGSIWKSSTSLNAADPKPTAPKPESRRMEVATKVRSKSVADMPRYGTHKPAPTRFKSVSETPSQGSKPAATSRHPAGFYSACPPARTVPATLASTSSRNTKVGPTKGSGTQTSKPKVLVKDRKANKPPVTSTLSQYRVTMETAEERRAKLATWQASKGKTFKRPAMTKAAPQKTKVSTKSEAEPKPQPQSVVEPQMASQSNYQPEPCLEASKPNEELPGHSQTPVIMNTTLDLLENSDADLPEPQEKVDDIVINLCDALEAMVTPSTCDDDVTNDTGMQEGEDESKQEKKNDVPQDVCEELKVEQVKDKEDEESDEEVVSDDDVMETTPETAGASVVKYSVKTTPYLQSVKKTIEGEVTTSTSKRKSNIKDLKFLTPVRRSCRIQRKSSHLPTMLVDHDPCVSSLAELVTLDDESNAYIYRKNPALLEDLPDQPRA